MADLTTLADVKAWLDIPADTGPDDTMLTALVSAVSAWVQNWLGRQIASASYSETRDGTGGSGLVLRQYPVQSVTTVTIGADAIVPRPAFGQVGYYLANDTLYLDGGLTFTRGYGNVLVTYTAGYASTPNDLAQVTKQLVALRYKERDRIGQVSKAIQGETVAFDVKALPLDVQNVLQNYKRVVWGR